MARTRAPADLPDLHLSFLKPGLNVGDLVDLLGDAIPVGLVGPRGAPVVSLSPFWAEAPSSLTYLAGARAGALIGDAAQIVICSPENEAALKAQIRLVVGDPRAALIRLLDLLHATGSLDLQQTLARHAVGLDPGAYSAHSSAIIEEGAIIGEGVQIGPNVVIHSGAIIGPGTIVRTGAVIGDEGAAVHKTADGELLAQRHVGTVRIEAGCEIGVQSSVARAMIGATRVGARTRIGNFVNVGHGVSVGERAWIAAGSIVGGHAAIGAGATLGLGSIIRDNVDVGSGASVGMGSVVTKLVPANASVFGNPAAVMDRRLKVGPKR